MLSLAYQGWEQTLVRVEPKQGYDIRVYNLKPPMFGRQTVQVQMAYNRYGERIGTPAFAAQLAERGIEPEWVRSYRDAMSTDRVCCVGFCAREQRWYGWGDVGLAGFAIGDVADEDNLATTSPFGPEYLEKFPECDMRVPVGFEAHTLEDAKRMAIAYADAVSVQRYSGLTIV